ncbi:IS66 family transposase [Novipirellula artificiosorum]|uniref:Transposase IS66 family protein n=1 Tax=Novipirellula artificiosorum TaxID=2528016 RepID=A0A5C6D9B4_9BACT|nr:IS66 family transposase [Novipirellula artificiosorum]TWU33733.1 Transposase IS66 family protein [Novipirellula artificiosorum]
MSSCTSAELDSVSKDRSNDLSDPDQPPKPKNRRGQQPGRPAPNRRDYSHLPEREQLIELPEDAKVCACCGEPLVGLGQSDPCEQIEIETILYRRVVRRGRYRRTCQCHAQPRTVTAPLPPKLLPKSIFGTSLWIHLLLEKFHLQRPTHRTIEQLGLLGVDLAAGTIAGGLKRIEPLLTPIYDAICDRQTKSNYFQADETRWKVFVEKAGKTGHLWWLWLFAGEDSIAYVLDPSRSHDVPQSHLSDDVQGVLMVDRYSAYKAIEQVKEGQLALAFCWAHVRRDFVKVGKGYPELVPWALQWLGRIAELYRLNRERVKHPIDSEPFREADAALRQHLDSMWAQRDVELSTEKLRDPCCKVITSLRKHWGGLTLFVDDPRIPLDNNYGERLIRNPALGRKNYYGSGAEWSGRLAVMMFSIFATLALWKINPYKWLSWYFEACAENDGKIPSDPSSFLPWNLSTERLSEQRSSPATALTSDTS